MKVREYLSTLKRVVITCRPEDTVETAATLLVTNQIGAMPVRDANGRIVGMLTERDIMRAAFHNKAHKSTVCWSTI